MILLQGLAMGAALILPLGPQNSPVMAQGLARHYAFFAATFCVFSDALLTSLGVMGIGELLRQSPWTLLLISLAGSGFLFWHSYGLLRRLMASMKPNAPMVVKQGWLPIISRLFAVTWLNPHVYLDTVVILGSIGSQLSAADRLQFISGAILASVLWFYLLAAASWLFSAWLLRPLVQRVVDAIVIIIMLSMAIQLAQKAIRMVLIHSL